MRYLQKIDYQIRSREQDSSQRTACTIARARFNGSPERNIPDPTNTTRKEKINAPGKQSKHLERGSTFTSIASKLHHERSVSRCRDPSSREADDWQPLQARSLLKEVERNLQLFRVIIELFLRHNSCSFNSGIHGACMTNSLEIIIHKNEKV